MSGRRAPTEGTLLIQALDGAGHGVWDWHIPSGEVYFSAGWASMLGFTLEELKGSIEDWRERVHEEDFSAASRVLELHFQGVNPSYSCEHRLRSKDGSYRWILAQGKVVERAEDGTPLRMIGTHTDMSQRRQIEDDLNESRLLLLEAQEVGRLGHWSFDLDIQRIRWSPQVFAIFGREPALGPPSFAEYQASIPEEDLPLVQDAINHSLTHDQVIEFRHRITTAKGEIRHVLCRCRRRCDGRGNPVSMLGTVMDISESVQTMRELENATRRAEQALQTRTAFLTMMSHEIRTPLNGIVGLLDLLTQTQLDEEQLDFANSARVASKTLLALLNEVLEFSRAEAGKSAPAEAPFSPRSVVESAAQMIALQAQQKGLMLLCDVESNVPERLAGDEARITQIALNLASNAVKFTDSGEIQIVCCGEQVSVDTFLFRLRVLDTGVGIDSELCSTLFEPYTTSSPSSQASGFGLGLAICKRLATLLGGELRAERLPERGSVFEFSVPLAVRAAPLSMPPNAHSKTIAILDAHERHRACTARLFSNGYRTREARSAEELSLDGVSVLVVDGELASESLLARCKAHVPQVSVVVLVPLSQRKVSLELGDGITVKPVCREILLRIVARLCGESSGEFAQTAGLVAKPDRILIAEDNPINQKVISAMLQKMGYDYLLVPDGAQAIAAIQRSRFQLILMDCFMPGVDGYQATQQIREIEDPHDRNIIVALTANALEGDRERCLECGMDDYLAKPIDFTTLSAAIGRHLRAARARRPPSS